MTTLYPNDTFISKDGSTTTNLVNGKYTNGSLSPPKPPSRLPAEQLNLWNDLLGDLITTGNQAVDNKDKTQLTRAVTALIGRMAAPIKQTIWVDTASYAAGDTCWCYLVGSGSLLRQYIAVKSNTNSYPITDDGTNWINVGATTGDVVWKTTVPSASQTGVLQLAGQPINNTPEYARLYKFMRDAYAAVGNFNWNGRLPDMRGRVARSIGGELTIDKTRTLAPYLFEAQEDAIQKMSGNFRAINRGNRQFDGVFREAGRYSSDMKLGNGDDWGSVYTFNPAYGGVFVADETRVKSLGLVACIVI